MFVQILNFKRKDISEQQLLEAYNQLAPAFAALPGLLSKTWLQPSQGDDTYGGVYFWADRKSLENFKNSDLFRSVQNHSNLTGFSSREYAVFEAPSRVTRGYVQGNDPVRRQIEDAARRFGEYFRTRNAAALADLYCEQATVLPPNMPPLQGRENIRQMWEAVFGLGIAGIKLETLEVDVSGDTAYETGRFTMSGSDGSQLDQGKYIVVWKHEGGQWRLFRDIWSSNQAVEQSASHAA